MIEIGEFQVNITKCKSTLYILHLQTLSSSGTLAEKKQILKRCKYIQGDGRLHEESWSGCQGTPQTPEGGVWDALFCWEGVGPVPTWHSKHHLPQGSSRHPIMRSYLVFAVSKVLSLLPCWAPESSSRCPCCQRTNQSHVPLRCANILSLQQVIGSRAGK